MHRSDNEVSYLQEILPKFPITLNAKITAAKQTNKKRQGCKTNPVRATETRWFSKNLAFFEELGESDWQ